MERMKLFLVAVAACVAFGTAAAQDKKKTDAPAAAAGPFNLPTFDQVKARCKLTEDQLPKVEAQYKEAATREEETRKRAKDNQTDRKDLEKFLGLGKVDAINKVKEILDNDQKKTFDGLVAAMPDPNKKKK
ncbi:MAG TPA: hypothetical protein VJB14_01965 [Planctomycetota bacterium]|nr:hypothetical protein [Planctomycetota bacterium]